MTNDDALDRLRLARTQGVGPVTYRRLMRRYPTAAAALAALPGLARDAGRGQAPRIPLLDAARREADQVAKLGGRMLFLDGPDYPLLLGLLGVAPPVLFTVGDVGALATKSVAIVGARNGSAAGQRMAENLASELALTGLVVVSGMARGIDTAAHEGALRTGRTVAVLGCGLDVAYPPENAQLQRTVAENGAVLSELPFGTPPSPHNFLRRNRIIAGLSLGVVVVEATPNSGSLSTARVAQEIDRELFAVPGSPLDPRCKGSNDLLRKGAHLVEEARDVLGHLPQYPDPYRPSPPPSGLAEQAGGYGDVDADPAVARARLLELVGFTPMPVDDLVRRCQFSAAAVAAALSDLELAGHVEMLPGHQVCLVAPDDRA